MDEIVEVMNMANRPPDITTWSWNDGTLTVNWEVDTFFGDSSDPDDVSVELDNATYKDHLGADARSIVIPSKDLAGLPPSFSVTVVFEWPEENDSQGSSINLEKPASFQPGDPGSPQKPTLGVVAISPKTIQNANQITISYTSYSYTEGEIDWGISGSAPSFKHPFTPGYNGPNVDYSGQFTTDQTLQPGAKYSFDVWVRNDQGTNTPVSSTITVSSAQNYHSVRNFLVASGATFPASLRTLGLVGGLRSSMGV